MHNDQNNKEIAFGAVPSIPDYRDMMVAQAMGEVPSTLPPYFHAENQGVYHQRKIPACVNHAIYKLGQIYWYRKTGKWINFSPRFGDVLAKRFDGQPLDGGTQPRLSAKLACDYGMATEATVKNDTTLPLATYRSPSILTPEAFADAHLWKLPGYIPIPIGKNSLRQAVIKYGAVALLFPIGEEWYTSKAGQSSWDKKDIMPLRSPHVPIGGHEVVQIGWDDASLERILNSWSISWADLGENTYDLSKYPPVEAIAIGEVPNEVKKLVKGMPSPQEFRHIFRNDLQAGQTGDEVRALQIAMAIEGCFNYPEITSTFGPVTQSAVVAFQKKYGIEPSAGYVGPKTRNLLNLLYNR